MDRSDLVEIWTFSLNVCRCQLGTFQLLLLSCSYILHIILLLVLFHVSVTNKCYIGVPGSILREWPNIFHLLSVISIDMGRVSVRSYNFWFLILCGHLMPIILLSCFLWKLSRYSFFSSCKVSPHVLQL